MFNFRALCHKRRAEQEMDEELRFHLEKQIEQNIAQGMSAEEARYAALRTFGNVGTLKEECRDSWGVRFINELVQDIRYGLRQLRRNPGFTAVAVLTLALGIGANTAIFSVVNPLFLRGLEVQDPGELVSLGFQQEKTSIPVFSYPDLKDIGDQAGNLMQVLAYKFGIDGLSEGGHADRVITNYVTGNYFSVLGIKPALGRLILPSEGLPGHSDSVIVLGYSYWKSRFGGDPDVIGKQVQIGGERVTIVGVAPKGFHGPLKEVDIQAFMPLNMVHLEFGFPLQSRHARGLFALGRLKPGVTLAEAQAALNVIANRLAQQYPDTDARAGIQVYPQPDAALTPMPQPGMYQKELAVMALFLTLAALVLLLACFNVANILLVRAMAREHEMTVRAALGAPGGRLVRQLLTESLLLALFGCGAGVLVGAWASRALSSIHIHMALPISLNFGLDWNVLGYSALAALLAGMIVGIMPAIRAASASPGAALHEGGRTASARHHRVRNALVVAQVAGSIVILTVAGLFTRSLFKARQMDLGFNSNHLINFTIDPHEVGYDDAQGREFYKNLLERVRALPGVKSTALAFTYPSNGIYLSADGVYIKGHLLPKGEPPPRIYVNNVSPDYFKTLGIPIVEGRPFADTDTATAPRVAVINETMARRFWPKEDPIGKQFPTDSATGKPWQVVGVARDSKYYDLFSKPIPYFYRSLDQDYISIQTLQVRSMLPPATLDRQVEEQIHELAPGLPIFDIQSMNQALDGGGFYEFRLGAYLAAALGLLGLILAAVGVYGVVSYSTSQRTREIGIRMALGARPADIWQSIFRQGLVIVGLGALAGIVIALGLTRVMSHMLFGVSASDPVTYLGVTILIAAVTLVACYIPARRAAKVDPMVALRYE
jgi:putative ABC transport system permease protein